MLKQTLLVVCGLVMATNANAAEFEFGGLLEFEYAHTHTRSGGNSDNQDLVYLATAEFGFGLKFNEHWRTDLILLAEDIENTDPGEFRPEQHNADDPPDQLHVDQLVLTYSQGHTAVSAGRFTLPFGDFETAVITDPQTLEVGETKTSLGATASHDLEHSWGNVNLNVTYFDGNLRSSVPDESGFAAGLDAETNSGIRFGVGYLSSQGANRDAPSLWNVYAAGEQGPWFWHAEYVAATEEKNGEKPRAWALDAGYTFNEQWSTGARYQQTDRAGIFEDGDGDYNEWAVAGFYSPWQHVTLGLEYTNGEEGDSKAEQWLMQVAVVF